MTTHASTSLWHTLWLGCALGALVGCSSHTAFQPTFPVNRDDQLRTVLSRLETARRNPGAPVVVGVSEAPRRVFAYDLAARRLLFATPAEVDGVPRAAGAFAVVPEAGEVRVRRLKSGEVVRSFDARGLSLVGADGDGDVTAFVLSSGGSYGAKSELVMLRGDSVTRKVNAEQALGAPAVLGGLVFVPHSRVHLSVLTPEGDELARLTVRDDVASAALSDGRHVYFGLNGLYRLDAQTPRGVAGGAHQFTLDSEKRRALPGAPDFLHDTTEPPPAMDSAVHRIALSFWPTSSDQAVGLANDALYLSFYRVLFALDETAKNAQWVRTVASDIVGMGAYPSGIVVAENDGTVRAFDAAGNSVLAADMGIAPVVADVRAEGFVGDAPSEPLPPRVEQLTAVALDDDTRLVPAGQLSLDLLGQLDAPEATETLIRVCSLDEAPERLRESACALLGARAQGNDAIVAALEKRNDFLANTHAYPLAPLSQAAAAAHATRAAPLLLDHLEDPSTQSDDLRPIVVALQTLAEPSQNERITRFLRLYHADARDPGLLSALVAAVPLVTKLDRKAAKDTLKAIADDPSSEAELRDAAQKQLAAIEQEAQEAAKPAAEAAKSSGEEAPPERLTSEHVAHALGPVQVAISECMRDDSAHPLTGRLTLVVDGQGHIESVATLPPSLKGCVEPLVRPLKLPETKLGKRETLHYPISR